MNEKIRTWIFEWKCFIYYIFTEPFRSIYLFFKMKKYTFIKLLSIKFWMYVLLTITIFATITNSKYKWALIAMLIVVILHYIWEKKEFVARYREIKGYKMR